MLFTDSNTHEIKPLSRVIFESDQEFTVYGLVDGEKVSVHPSNNRRLRLFPAEQVDALLVDIPKGGIYTVSIDQLPPPQEIADPRPVEIPLGLNRPLTLKEEMRRFIREEFSNYATTQGAPSFEEEDDFDIDDDDTMPFSKYELPEDMALMKPEPDMVDYDLEGTDSKDEPPPNPEAETPKDEQVA